MDKKIPLYFDSVIIDSPFQDISESNPNIGRLKVRVFTKYGNRNGSYITEAVANQLIETATQGTTPVIGFFDPETQTWASHSGPTLANAYGYVESFLGWEPFQDTDGITREYAVFSVILFTDYYEEAKKILGQNQSMELDPASITGDWTMINNEEFYVYKTAKMLGFCIIGEHEPCFSVSSFFSKNDDIYNNQYEKISSLLFSLKAQVEEAEKGGEQPMNDFENQEFENQVENTDPQNESTFQENSEPEVSEPVNEGAVPENNEEEPVSEPETEANDFSALQEQFSQLQNSYDELQSNYAAAQSRITELEEFQANANSEIEGLRSTNEQLQTSIQNYEAKIVVIENTKKENLIEKYAKVLSAEEINEVKEKINDFSYEELESKLAITFANSKITGEEIKKVPLPEPVESQFALLMKNYRKN